MFRFRWGFGLFLVAAIAFILGFYTPGYLGIALEGIAITLAILASIQYFDEQLSRAVQPVVKHIRNHTEQLVHDVEDDWESVVEFRPTRVWLMFLFTTVSTMFFFLLVKEYDKYEASWRWFGRINVSVIGLSVLAIVVTYLLVRWQYWFRTRDFYLPRRAYAILLIGIVLTTSLGIFIKEPTEYGKTQMEIAQTQASDRPANEASPRGGGTTVIVTRPSSPSPSIGAPSIDMPECSGKNCGAVYLVILLIILVAILVLGSAFISHFWVLAGFILLTLMALLTWRELRVREYR